MAGDISISSSVSQPVCQTFTQTDTKTKERATCDAAQNNRNTHEETTVTHTAQTITEIPRDAPCQLKIVLVK